MANDNIVEFPPGRCPKGYKAVDVPDWMPMDIDDAQVRLEEARGVLDMLSDHLRGTPQSIALTAHRLVCDAYEALFGARNTKLEQEQS